MYVLYREHDQFKVYDTQLNQSTCQIDESTPITHVDYGSFRQLTQGGLYVLRNLKKLDKLTDMEILQQYPGFPGSLFYFQQLKNSLQLMEAQCDNQLLSWHQFLEYCTPLIGDSTHKESLAHHLKLMLKTEELTSRRSANEWRQLLV